MDLVSEAKQQVENMTPDQVAEELTSGDAVLIDIRESQEPADFGGYSWSSERTARHARVLRRLLPGRVPQRRI